MHLSLATHGKQHQHNNQRSADCISQRLLLTAACLALCHGSQEGRLRHVAGQHTHLFARLPPTKLWSGRQAALQGPRSCAKPIGTYSPFLMARPRPGA